MKSTSCDVEKELGSGAYERVVFVEKCLLRTLTSIAVGQNLIKRH